MGISLSEQQRLPSGGDEGASELEGMEEKVHSCVGQWMGEFRGRRTRWFGTISNMPMAGKAVERLQKVSRIGCCASKQSRSGDCGGYASATGSMEEGGGFEFRMGHDGDRYPQVVILRSRIVSG